MDFVTNKAFMVAVGVFVTIIITSAVFVIIGYVLNIYSTLSTIDYASLMKIGPYDRYSVTEYDTTLGKFKITPSSGTLNGVEIYNMLNKFKSDDHVTYNYEGSIYKNNKSALVDSFKSGTLYNDNMLKKEYYCSTLVDDLGNVTFIVKAKV